MDPHNTFPRQQAKYYDLQFIAEETDSERFSDSAKAAWLFSDWAVIRSQSLDSHSSALTF